MLVVFTHGGGFSPEVEPFFKSFRMPLYFFLSGLFFKPYESFAGFLKRKINKLLIPFFFFYFATSVLMGNVVHWLGLMEVNSVGLRSLYAYMTTDIFFNFPIWFLLCLFWVNVIFYGIYLLAKRLTRNDMAFVVMLSALSLMCGGLGYLAYRSEVEICAFVDTALSCMPFYCVGYILRKHTSLLYPNNWDKWLPLLFVIACVLTFVFRGGMQFAFNEYDGSPVVVLLGGVFGTLAVLFLAKMIGRLPFISHWGRYSIIILCTHRILLNPLVLLADKFGVIATLGRPLCVLMILIVVMFSYELIIPLCVRFIPWFTAQKDLIKV